MKTTFAGQKPSLFFNQLSIGAVFTCSSDGDGLFIKSDTETTVMITPRHKGGAGLAPGWRCHFTADAAVWPIEELTVKIKD